MAIESASFISDLNTSNPPGSDPVGQADDHIRLLKSVLKATFPNLTGAVTSTQAQLNASLVPTGLVAMWSGSSSSVPTGWALCNGQTAARSDGTGNITTPDLRDRFVVSSGTTYAVGSTGGASSVTPTVTLTNQAVTLTESHIPAHSHTATVTDPGHNHTLNDPGHSHSYDRSGTSTFLNGSLAVTVNSGLTNTVTGTQTTGITINNRVTGITVSNSSFGGSQPHIHNNTAACSAVATIPPYYALAFIMKL